MPDSTQARNHVDVIHQSRFYCGLEGQTIAVMALAKRTAAASAGSGRHPVARRLVAGDPGQKAGGHALAGPSCAASADHGRPQPFRGYGQRVTLRRRSKRLLQPRNTGREGGVRPNPSVPA